MTSSASTSRCTPGAHSPLRRPDGHDAATFVHGESGLDGADLPAPTTPLDSADAVGFIIETCRSVDDVWLVPVGPLTNIALALRTAPDIADRIAGISLMGGGTFGNRTPTGEFNIWADPEAAAIVFGYGGPLVMAGLDVTHQFQATPERIAAIDCAARRARRRARRSPDVLQRELPLAPRPGNDARRRRPRSARGVGAHAPRAVRPGGPPCRDRDPGRTHPRDDRDRPARDHRSRQRRTATCSPRSTTTPRSTC